MFWRKMLLSGFLIRSQKRGRLFYEQEKTASLIPAPGYCQLSVFLTVEFAAQRFVDSIQFHKIRRKRTQKKRFFREEKKSGRGFEERKTGKNRIES